MHSFISLCNSEFEFSCEKQIIHFYIKRVLLLVLHWQLSLWCQTLSRVGFVACGVDLFLLALFNEFHRTEQLWERHAKQTETNTSQNCFIHKWRTVQRWTGADKCLTTTFSSCSCVGVTSISRSDRNHCNCYQRNKFSVFCIKHHLGCSAPEETEVKHKKQIP